MYIISRNYFPCNNIYASNCKTIKTIDSIYHYLSLHNRLFYRCRQYYYLHLVREYAAPKIFPLVKLSADLTVSAHHVFIGSQLF